ncbi:hypothetical protein BDA96_05G186000 [Sorghum bicolor]|uniref:Uncharacterized protein n=1 Tax=Sorghum bicolor TaxID=4558 RepID=A0A921QZK4_SORBI|nr:hypothetical protein BDA96_05G186000 [Sorghum bicolor]
MAVGFAVVGPARRRRGRIRGAVLRHGGHGRRHLRLRHQHGGRRVVCGRVPAGVLPGRVPPDEACHRRQQLLAPAHDRSRA